MKREDKIKLGVISSIDDDFIDEATKSRVLYSSKSKKSFFRSPKFAAIAASVAIIISSLAVFFTIMLNGGKEIPVYRGMTVSSEAPIKDESTASLISTELTPTERFAVPTKTNTNGIENKFDDSLNIVGPEKELYYANPGDDIYITIHIDNPDKFEILSFTLNEIKYTAYMFEYGSDMENLILKVNVGENPGLISYTIDAIKYVDGEKIKDVKMSGEKTVNIGVSNPIKPSAKISDKKLTATYFSFNATITDTEGLVAATNGSLYAVLLDGEGKIIRQIELALGMETNVKFDNLDAGNYTYAVIAVYDAYDGEGFGSHVLSTEKFSNVTQLDVKYTGMNNYPTKNVLIDVTSYNGLVTVEKAEIIRESDGAVLGKITDPDNLKIRANNVTTLKIPTDENNACGTCYVKLSCSYIVDDEKQLYELKSKSFAMPMVPVVGEIIEHYENHQVIEWGKNYFAIHRAVDFAPTTSDKNVYSCTDGTVVSVKTHSYHPNGEYLPGTTVEISFINEEDLVEIIYSYSMLENVTLKVGDTVKMGDVIGTVGEFDHGFETHKEPHLHLAIYRIVDGYREPIKPPFVPSEESILNHELFVHNRLMKVEELNAWYDSNPRTYDPVIVCYGDVKIEYETESEYLEIDGGLFTFDFDSMPIGETEITIKITATLGEATKDVYHTLLIEKEE